MRLFHAITTRDARGLRESGPGNYYLTVWETDQARVEVGGFLRQYAADQWLGLRRLDHSECVILEGRQLLAA